MIVTVEFPVDIRVLDSKIRAEIEDTIAAGKKRLRKFRREAVRQRQKNDGGGVRDLFCVGIRKLQRDRFFVMGQARKNFRQRFASQLTRSRRDQINVRVRE